MHDATRETTYHRGEREVQERANVVRAATSSLDAIRNAIPDAAADFLAERQFLVVAAAAAGQRASGR